MSDFNHFDKLMDLETLKTTGTGYVLESCAHENVPP